MYEFRNWSDEERTKAIFKRIKRGYPCHSPPHIQAPPGYRIVTGSCYEHQEILSTPERLQWFEGELLRFSNRLPCPVRLGVCCLTTTMC